ncbi:hypothetical protein P691DRAFT_682937 [Macrolepiota fuliginosa MF-IS2]|uniref:CNH domain-containing protein n=1 Tax=Macrolepiota fuliginosa MF-IS2 TaxID=1400762 RepID=A0A9P5X2M2_9AGAR|nr:hypothetical protein P691DRAFT_682937 [Macrolepiota fuliginosa MF-IS2]
MSTPTDPPDIPPFQVQQLIQSVFEDESGMKPRITCAQALASEIYVGCSNGELIRFALQADDPNKLESYTILSRRTLPADKAIDDIVVLPSLSRLLVQSDRQIHVYTLPSLDPVNVKPIRNVVRFAVDHRHLQRPPIVINEPVDFSVIKRSGIAMFSLRNDRLFYQKEIPLPAGSPPALAARRIGLALCYADDEYYNMVDLDQASLYQLLPLRQSPDPTPFEVKPLITIIVENEFLILSWTGTSALGLFITGEGDPVRGTLTWAGYPKAVCLDYPYITALLPDETIEVHSVETQATVQVVGAPVEFSVGRLSLVASLHGYLVPSTQRSGKMRKVEVDLLRRDRQDPTTDVQSS